MSLHTENETAQSITDPIPTEEEHSDKPNQESDVGGASEQVPSIEAYLDHSDVASVASNSSHAPSVRKAGSASRSGSSCQSRDIVRSAVGESDPSSLAEFDVMKFRNNYLQAVEELRMRRALDVENEDKIKELMAQKHQLQQKCDDVERNYHKALDQCSNQEQETRRKLANQMKLIEEEKTKQSCSEESREMEIKALKDEIRALHLAKYNVEKKVEEQERQLQLQSTSRESFMAEMSQLEQKCHAAVRQGSEIVEQMAHLETNVKQAVELNRKLQYVNEHQKCILEGYKRELESCRQQLVDTRVSLADRQAEMVEGGEQAGRRTRATEQDLKMHTELTKQLQLQLTSLREEYQRALQQLKEAHSLIDKHVESNSRLQASEGVLKEEVANLQGSNEKLQTDLTALQQRIASQANEWASEKHQSKTKTAEIECRLRSLQEDYTALQESHDRLEAEGRARVAELESQLTEMAGREKSLEEKAVQEREILMEEWAGKVRVLERSLEQSEACLQEKKKTIQDKEVQVPDESVQHPACSPQSTEAKVEDSSSKTDGSRSSGSDSVESDKYVDKLESPQKKESQGTTRVSPLPIPPKSQGLSPEVISPSSSPNLEQESSMSITAKLPSPRVHLERIQLPFREKGVQIAHTEEDCRQDGSNGRPLSPEQQIESHQTNQVNCHSEQETVHPTPDSPAPLKRKVENNQAVSGDGLTVCDTPSKKQKISNPCHDNSLLGGTKNTTALVSSPPYQEPFKGENSLSQPTHTSEIVTFLPLSQPCHSNTVSATSHVRVGTQEKRRSSLRSVPWKLEIPRPPSHVTRQLTTQESDAVPPSREGRNDLSKTGSSAFQMPFIPQSPTSSPRQLDTTQNLSCPKKATSLLPEGDNKLQLEMSPSSPMQLTCSKTTSTLNENANCLLLGTQPSKEGHLSTVIDQSGPDSATVDNFAVVFSDGEDDGEGSDSLINSQINRQINKVHTFLKMDRLRRTKSVKHS